MADGAGSSPPFRQREKEMIRNAVGKVMWVGRATVFLVGLAVILALLFGAASMAFATNGQPLILGARNLAQSLTTLKNQGAGPALSLEVGSGAPLKVDSTTRVAKLNADRVDNMEASALAPPRGYAHVNINGSRDDTYPSKGVNSVVIPMGATNLYCFDLDFTPHASVGSAYLTNAAWVSTVTPPNNALDSCPATHRDAAARTYGAHEETELRHDGSNPAPINFQIVFI